MYSYLLFGVTLSSVAIHNKELSLEGRLVGDETQAAVSSHADQELVQFSGLVQPLPGLV